MGRQVEQNANEQRLWRPLYSGKAEEFVWPRQPRIKSHCSTIQVVEFINYPCHLQPKKSL